MLHTRPGHENIAAPLISVVMANYQAGTKIVRALDSVLNQSVESLEVIVSDDASGDDSVALVRQAMSADGRVRLIEAERNGGPARARNRALDAARGQWVAVVDADDIIHPERFERLLAAASHFGADVVADDLLHFHEDGSPVTFLLGDKPQRPFAVTAEDWVLAGTRANTAPLGYLKPMIKAETLGSIRYDETLRIGEDYDLLLRVLLTGANFHVIPVPWYLYRRHSSSISHRLSADDVGSMIGNQQRLIEQEGPFPESLQSALDQRMQGLEGRHVYETLVAAIKRRDIAAAARLLAGRPTLALRLWHSLADGQRNRSTLRRDGPIPGPAVLRLSGEPSTTADASKRQVPPYVAAAATDWDQPSPRQILADLANLGSGRDLKTVCDDIAGTYAAGFIPAARLEIVSRPVAEGAVLDRVGVAAK